MALSLTSLTGSSTKSTRGWMALPSFIAVYLPFVVMVILLVELEIMKQKNHIYCQFLWNDSNLNLDIVETIFSIQAQEKNPTKILWHNANCENLHHKGTCCIGTHIGLFVLEKSDQRWHRLHIHSFVLTI